MLVLDNKVIFELWFFVPCFGYKFVIIVKNYLKSYMYKVEFGYGMNPISQCDKEN